MAVGETECIGHIKCSFCGFEDEKALGGKFVYRNIITGTDFYWRCPECELCFIVRAIKTFTEDGKRAVFTFYSRKSVLSGRS